MGGGGSVYTPAARLPSLLAAYGASLAQPFGGDPPDSPPTAETKARVTPWASLTFPQYRLLWGGIVFGLMGQQMREVISL